MMEQMEMTRTKKCSRCGEVKDVNEFSKNKRVKDGLDYLCRYCRAKACKESKIRRHNLIWDWATGEKMIGMKRCTKCGAVKDRSEFNKDRARRDGLTSECRSCRYKVQKEYHDRNGKNNIKIVKMVGTKKCSRCGEVKDVNEFSRDRTTKNGLYCWCKSCDYKVDKEQRKNDPERFRKQDKEEREKRPYYRWATETLTGHRKRGIKIEMSYKELEEIAINTKCCLYCGCELKRNHRYQERNSPTLDRINNENVIRRDNIMIICNQCNRTKGARTLQEFIDYCKHIASLQDIENLHQHGVSQIYKEKRPNHTWAIGTLKTHRQKGIKTEMSTRELEEMTSNIKYCPLCGCELKVNCGDRAEQNLLTLDRINNENVIRRDNIMIICNQCNSTKGERTLQEFIDYCKHIALIENEIKEGIYEEI